jgi:hypothetical protein
MNGGATGEWSVVSRSMREETRMSTNYTKQIREQGKTDDPDCLNNDDHKNLCSFVPFGLCDLVYFVYTGSLAILLQLCIYDSFPEGQQRHFDKLEMLAGEGNADDGNKEQ